MEILGYIIPKDLQKSPFILSLHDCYKKTNKLSKKQHDALIDMIGVTLDFYDYEYTPSEESEYKNDYLLLRKKLKKNNFRSSKGINNCVRALNSIIDNNPNSYLIDVSLGRINIYHWR